MAFSVNTNPGAFVALQSLFDTNQALATTQNRISTGLNVAGVEDNSSSFIIAQNIRTDIAGFDAISSSLDNATGALDVGIAAAETVSDLLIESRAIALAASDEGLDDASRAALEDDFQALRAQIESVGNSAEFNGTNILNGSGDSISALIDLAGGVTGATISVAGVSLNITAAGSDLALTVSGFSDAQEAQDAIVELDDAASTLNGILASLGAAANQIALQAEFTSNLQDTLTVGVGNIVDADLAAESANLQSLQVQQQLGLTAAGIANAAPSSLLALFG